MLIFWNRLLRVVMSSTKIFQSRLYKCMLLHNRRLYWMSSDALQAFNRNASKNFSVTSSTKASSSCEAASVRGVIRSSSWCGPGVTALHAGVPSGYEILISLAVVKVLQTTRSVPMISTNCKAVLAWHPTSLQGTIPTCILFHKIRTWTCRIWNKPVKIGTASECNHCFPCVSAPQLLFENLHLFSYLLGCVWSK